jgi:hypothetical protein
MREKSPERFLVQKLLAFSSKKEENSKFIYFSLKNSVVLLSDRK